MSANIPLLEDPERRRAISTGVEVPSSPTLIRSSTFWLADGNVILRAPELVTVPALVHYKVHKSVLSRHCEYFRAFFENGNLRESCDDEYYDGLWVVDTYATHTDTEAFLRSLYDPSFTHRHRRCSAIGMTRAEFPKAYDGVLDLAIRYQAEDLKSVVVASLKDDWPSALTHWDMREATIRTEMKGSDGSPNSFYPNPVDAIQMAMEHKIYDILPAAFYDLSRLYHIEKLSPEEYGKPRTYNLGSWPLELRIIQGVVAIQERTSARFVDSDLRRSATCERPPTDTSCQMRIDQFLGGPVRRAARISFDPIGWMNQATAFSGGLEACRTCRAACAKGMQDIRRELWMQLPDCFELREHVGENWGKV